MIKERLNTIIRKYCDEENKQKQSFEGMHLIDDLHMDSVDLMQIIVDAEKEFAIEFDLEECGIETLCEYDEMVKYIERKNRG